MGFVLDGSVALAAVLPDEAAGRAEALLLRSVQEGAWAPSIWPFEVANALLMAQRRGRVTEAFRLQTLGDLRRLPVRIDGEGTAFAWSDVSRLAASHGLTVYDASYLELALRLGLPLATLDQRLASAAQRETIETL